VRGFLSFNQEKIVAINIPAITLVEREVEREVASVDSLHLVLMVDLVKVDPGIMGLERDPVDEVKIINIFINIDNLYQMYLKRKMEIKFDK